MNVLSAGMVVTGDVYTFIHWIWTSQLSQYNFQQLLAVIVIVRVPIIVVDVVLDVVYRRCNQCKCDWFEQ